MSWIADAASVLGVPAGVATFVTAMYGACGAAEKVARPEALKEIARLLTGRSWADTSKALAAIERTFAWTFGERQFSWRAVGRSFLSSTVILVAIICIFGELRDQFSHIYLMDSRTIRHIIVMIFLLGYVSDYISLGKTRIILRVMKKFDGWMWALFAAILDITVTWAIWLMILLIGTALNNGLSSEGVVVTIGILILVLSGLFEGDYVELSTALILSTSLTGVWITSITLSMMFIKVASPLHRIATWFFDVQKMLLRSISIVVGIGVFLFYFLATIDLYGILPR